MVSVIQKSREIGILRAMGTSRGQVLRVFLIQGAIHGADGLRARVAAAWGFLLLWRAVARNPDGTPMFIIEMQPALFAVAAAGAILGGPASPRWCRRGARRGSTRSWRYAAERAMCDGNAAAGRRAQVLRRGTPVENEVLHGIDLVLERGEFAALIGPSGSGKSTLLNVIGLLDRPSGGRVFVEGTETAGLGDAELTRLRGRAIGFVFQHHYLLPEFTALENVMMPILAARGRPDAEMRETAGALARARGPYAVARQEGRRTSPAASSSASRSRARSR